MEHVVECGHADDVGAIDICGIGDLKNGLKECLVAHVERVLHFLDKVSP